MRENGLSRRYTSAKESRDVQSQVKIFYAGIFEETPLHYAAEGGHLDIVKAFVEAGSDPQLLDTGGRTPLRCAQLNQHSAVVDYLEPRIRAAENL